MMSNQCESNQMSVDERGRYEQEVEMAQWDGDPEPVQSDVQINCPQVPLEQASNSSWSASDLNTLAKAQEETTKKALLLRRNELKWKLMQVSQTKNKARLDEIKQEMKYHREKLSKTQDLAARLRDRYVKVIKSAKLSENQLRNAESQFQNHEKFVAEEKMELTKIALDCLNIGRTLYGNSYVLPANPTNSCSSSKSNGERPRVEKAAETGPPPNIEDDLRASLLKKRRSESSGRLSGIYDRKHSILKNIVSYRLISKFASREHQQFKYPLTDLTHSHNYSPDEFVCLPDLISKCPDKNCAYKHKSSYMISDDEKLGKILASRPSLSLNFLLTLQMDHNCVSIGNKEESH